MTLLATAVLLLGTYAAAMIHGFVSGRIAVYQFDHAKSQNRAEHRTPSEPASFSEVDFSLWSEKRVRGYTESLSHPLAAPLASLSMPKFKIRVAVFEGTDELVLNRGVGWIVGTARPGQSGNSGIAGHRDGFFRALKDISLGDEIRLETMTASMLYAVDNLEIVKPDNVSVLGKRHADSLTLVTCYPFYFVGDAPERFIVHAVRRRPDVPTADN